VGAVVIFRDVTAKKADHNRLLAALAEVESLKNRLERENAYLQEEISSGFNHHQLIGGSLGIRHTMARIELVAPTPATVLISGESGTGKELIARTIHELSPRARRALIRVNCAAIPAELFESEFFGHVKGAFTGAHSDRPGRFELADGGTLLLDEVGEIPLQLQGKLLRVLQEQQFERVGDGRTRHVDVRIIAATNRDLKQRVAAGLFREDLYFRLNVFPIEAVPLRRRKDDIPALARHFLHKACLRLHKSGLQIAPAELDQLQHYHWPGNIRELENVVERQVILARDGRVRFDGLPVEHCAETARPLSGLCPDREPAPAGILSEEDFRAMERANLLAAHNHNTGKVSGAGGAAHLLGVKPTTLASRLKKYGIAPRDIL
jgi:transcriptional regulator with GAF, ATPase, and Fis domain